MISDLDETIRHILFRDGGFDSAEIDVSFDLPRREWSAGISRPTINCYLFDIRENLDLRDDGWEIERRPGGNGMARRRPSLRYDLGYLVTAWTRAVEDEHRLLWHALQTLARHATLPTEHLQGALRQHELPIYTRTCRPDGDALRSAGEFWTALENLLKPSLSYVVTLALDREAVPAGPPVLTSSLRFRQTGAESEELLSIAGTLRGRDGAPIGGAAVALEGRGAPSVTDDEGRFRLPNFAPGRYALVARHGQRSARRAIDVPAPEYDLTFDDTSGD